MTQGGKQHFEASVGTKIDTMGISIIRHPPSNLIMYYNLGRSDRRRNRPRNEDGDDVMDDVDPDFKHLNHGSVTRWKMSLRKMDDLKRMKRYRRGYANIRNASSGQVLEDNFSIALFKTYAMGSFQLTL
jgi:hypothetical protein